MNLRVIVIVIILFFIISYGLSFLTPKDIIEKFVKNPNTQKDVLLNLIRNGRELSYDFISNEIDCVNTCKEQYQKDNLSCQYIRPLHLQITQYGNLNETDPDYTKNVKKTFKSICVCNYGC